jgi:hypothetical protein
MTPSQLKSKVIKSGHCPYFFLYETMRFHGDTMRNYGVRDAGKLWELYRKRPTKFGLQDSVFFCKKTFKKSYRWL